MRRERRIVSPSRTLKLLSSLIFFGPRLPRMPREASRGLGASMGPARVPAAATWPRSHGVFTELADLRSTLRRVAKRRLLTWRQREQVKGTNKMIKSKIVVGLCMCAIATFLLTLGEESAEAYTWTEYCTASPCYSDAQPTLAGSRARGTATTPTLIPLAVHYGGASTPTIFALSTTTNASGDFELWKYNGNTWVAPGDADGNKIYLRGVTFDQYLGKAFGWKKNGDIWDNTSGTWAKEFSGYTSIASYDYSAGASSEVHATSNSASCSGTGVPDGQCLKYCSNTSWPTCTWNPVGSPAWGGELVVAPATSGGIFAILDSSGDVWVKTSLTTIQYATTSCAGSALAFDDIAMGDGYLGLDDPSGAVWRYDLTCPGGGPTGWEQVGNTSGYLSVEADDFYPAGQFWATDGSGKIWMAN
jgi:hypothetical protein